MQIRIDYAYLSDETFMRGRACAGLPEAIFYPELGQKYTTAAKVCASCPVVALCKHYFLDDESRCYVADMTPDQREQERKDLARKAS